MLLAPGAANGFNTQLMVGSGPITLGGNSTLSVAVQASGSNTYGTGGTQYVILSQPTGTIANSFKNLKGAIGGASPQFAVQYMSGGVFGTVLTDMGTPGGTLFNSGVATPADTVLLVASGIAVTPVTLDAFDAKVEGAAVRLAWHAASEFQNAGFNVFRRAMQEPEDRSQESGDWGLESGDRGRETGDRGQESGDRGQESGVRGQESGWTRVNLALIAGRLTNPDARTYSLTDWAEPGVYEYKLESISLQGATETYRDFAGPVRVDSIAADSSGVDSTTLDSAIASIEQTAAIQNGMELSAKFAALDGDALPPATVRAVSKPADIVAAPSAVPAITAPASARWFSSVPTASSNFTAAKVVYSQAGVMLIPQSMLPPGFDIGHASIQREGCSVPVLAQTPAGLLVYAQGYQDDYTNKDALFLRTTSAPTAAGVAARASGLFSSNQPVNTESPASVTSSYHDVYFDYNTAYRPYTFAPWFSNKYLTDGIDQSFSVSTPNASSGAAALTVNLWSLTPSDHALQVVINGQPAGQAQWSGGGQMMQLSFQIPSGVLNAGDNTIDLVTPAVDGVDSQLSFLHSISFSYTQTLDGSQPVAISNTGSTTNLYELSNLPGADAWVVDARFPDRAALVPYEAQPQTDGTYRLRFNAASGGTGQFLVVRAGQENLPISIARRSVKPLKSAPYVATGPIQFSAGVQPLLMLHSKEGIKALFVDQEQLFDYYNYGRYGPVGIQNAVRATRPQYLLLAGRTTYDYLNFSGANVDPLCPTFLVSTSLWAQATSDSTFGDLGRGYPEVAVGRLPVNNASELAGAVAHILSYNGAPSSGVRLHAVADATDPAVGDFAAQLTTLQAANPDLSWQPNYLGTTYATSPEVTAAMTRAANGGADWILYSGHGNSVHLGKNAPTILDTAKVQAWNGNAVLLQSTCTGNWMANDTQDFKSIAIQALTQPQGGISASIGTSTYMNPDCAVAFMGQLLKNADSGGMRWGNALMKSQQWASRQGSGFYADLNKTEQIFGDPAMPVFQNSKPQPNAGAATQAGTF